MVPAHHHLNQTKTTHLSLGVFPVGHRDGLQPALRPRQRGVCVRGGGGGRELRAALQGGLQLRPGRGPQLLVRLRRRVAAGHVLGPPRLLP